VRYDFTSVARALASEGLGLVRIETGVENEPTRAVLHVQELDPVSLPEGWHGETLLAAIFPKDCSLEDALEQLRISWAMRGSRTGHPRSSSTSSPA
jgi:hypothetical protein